MAFDSVRVTIVRGCDADGKGGEIADTAAVVMAEAAPGVQLLDVACAAVLAQRPIPRVPDPTEDDPQGTKPAYDKYRNLTMFMRAHVEAAVQQYGIQKKQEESLAAAAAEHAAVVGSLKVVEGPGE